MDFRSFRSKVITKYLRADHRGLSFEFLLFDMASATRAAVVAESTAQFARVIQSVLGYSSTSEVWLALQDAEIDSFIDFVGMTTDNMTELGILLLRQIIMGCNRSRFTLSARSVFAS